MNNRVPCLLKSPLSPPEGTGSQGENYSKFNPKQI